MANKRLAPCDRPLKPDPKKVAESYHRAKHDSPYFMRQFLNFTPREDQMKVLTSLKAGARRICLVKGRRWGGSKLTSAFALTACAQHPGLKVGIYGPGWDETEVFMDHLYAHLERSRINASVSERQKFKIQFTNGSIILGRICSKTAQGKRGRGFDLLIFTEAGFIPDSELHIVRLGKLDNPKAVEILESSPNGMNHLWVSYNDPDFVSFKFPSHLNPLISKKELAKERAKMTKIQAAQELDAEFIDDSTAPFPQVLIDEAVSSSAFEKWWTHKEQPGYYVAGLDLGRKRDRSVMFIWKVGQRGHLQGVHCHQFTYNPDDPRFWSKVIDHSEYLSKEYGIQRLLVDCTGLGDKVVMDMKNQFAENKTNTRIEGFNFTYASKNKWEGLMNQLSLKFERYLLHFPFHLDFIKQLKSIRFNSEKLLYENIGKSPDIVMAAALGAMAAPTITNFFHSKANAAPKEDLLNKTISTTPAVSYP